MSFDVIKKLRNELRLNRIKKEVFKTYGNFCSNCNSNKSVEIHHIVPLINGGTNNIKNLIPLCKECHLKAHDKSYKNNSKLKGRPQIKNPNNFSQIMYAYCNNEIGKLYSMELLGVKKSVFDRMTKQYIKENNISKSYNNIDLLESQSKRLKNKYKRNGEV